MKVRRNYRTELAMTAMAKVKEDSLKRKLIKQIIENSLTHHEIRKIVDFADPEPFEILGPHLFRQEKIIAIRAFLPRACEAWIQIPGAKNKKKLMQKIHPSGFYQAIFEDVSKIFTYQIGFRDPTGYVEEREDPYAFATQITDFDLHLFAEGSHLETYEKFGAKVVTFNGVRGVHFAVWAPNAKSVSVIGNFNHWRPGAHPMTRIKTSGVWGLFVPGLKEGEVYKFAIKSSADHYLRLKSDPYAFQTELRPQTASVVTSLNQYSWHDAQWIKDREKRSFLDQPISIYEVHLGSWRRDEKTHWGFLNYREIAKQLVDYVNEMGYTHIQLLPVMEHPLDESWGYQVVNYYAPTSRFGSPQDFMYFIDYCHQHGIGVLLDWVPAHFPKDWHGLADFDGRQIYAYEGWKKGEHRDWGTLVFDYGRNEVKNFLIANALFWLDKYHLDGLRVDAVASMLYLDYSRNHGEWEPNQYGGNQNLEAIEFLKKFNEIAHARHPGILTIAEESTAWAGVSRPTYAGGIGFSMKWNMGWMHDTLEYFSKEPVHRKHHQGMLTFSLLYAFTENFILPISHDEVVHGKQSLVQKMPGDDWQKFANTRLFLGYMFTHPGKKLLFMTNDIGQRREWNSSESMDWHLLNYEPHRQLNLFVKDLNRLYRGHRALYEIDFDAPGFEWVDFSDEASSVMSFLRWSRDRKQHILITCNMTPVPRMKYRVGAPSLGFYQEILNSDAKEYGGSGIGNSGGVHSEPVPCQWRSHSLCLDLPPLAVNVFKYETV